MNNEWKMVPVDPTDERDGLLAEVERLEKERASAVERCHEFRSSYRGSQDELTKASAFIKVLREQNEEFGRLIDLQQSELTKTREFLVHIKKYLVRNKEYAPLSHQELDGLIGHSPSASCRNECGCLWCHQSAPAAKGDE